MRKTFENEKGNKITISVNKSKKGSVNVRIIGPKSMSENILTSKEAKILKKLL